MPGGERVQKAENCYIDKMYDADNNYYEQVCDDYELSADRLTIIKVC
jgi:archaellum component FlaF (FlaF/FlaG flagellin family)